MPNIKDLKYKAFIDTGLIEPIEKEEFAGLLMNVKHKHLAQARALMIILFYSGRRPSEVLELTPKQVTKDGRYIKILFPTGKKGRHTLNYYPLSNPHLKEFFDYASAAGFEDFKIFWAFRNKTQGNPKKRLIGYTLKSGEKRVKEYAENSSRLRYYIKLWSGLTPYFFRHNRFSSMIEAGADIQDIKHAKGSKTLASVEPYIHLSKKTAKKLSKYYK